MDSQLASTELAATKLELSVMDEPRISARTSRAIIAFVREHMGPAALSRVFQGLLVAPELESLHYCYRGKALDLAFFENADNWVPNSLMQRLYRNLEREGVDAYELGFYAMNYGGRANQALLMSLLQRFGVNKTLARAAQINAHFNQTKHVSLRYIDDEAAIVRADYVAGVKHSAFITEFNLGAYAGILHFLRLEQIKCWIVADETEQEPGYSIIRARWKKPSYAQRLVYFFSLTNSKIKRYFSA
ncbi:hypothetical protein [Agaribacterium haliotis]|uniref:hypothetical protein n=1 Tax=Agaribacterium haliotis TaxID=2013869 RepID=UPI000BB598BC|nr:hypothetical protein [Agaribacterium haliotis]